MIETRLKDDIGALLARLRAEQPRSAPRARPFMHEMLTILREVSAETGWSVEALKGPGRSRPLPAIRAEFYRRAFATGRFSTTQIGRVLNRDHTSVLYSLGKLKRKPSWGV